MSRFQQIRVRIEPHYPHDLAGAFPRLQRRLSGVDNRLIEASPPLIELVPVLVRLSLDDQQDAAVLAVVKKHLEGIKAKAGTVEEAVGEWNLSEAETALNELEDLLVGLEEALPE